MPSLITLSSVLKLNAFCTTGMGLAFLLSPDSMIPDLTANGRTTTRVLASCLFSVGYTSWTLRKEASCSVLRLVTQANLLFHILAAVVLGIDYAAQPHSSPFLPPTVLHVVLTISFLLAKTERKNEKD